MNVQAQKQMSVILTLCVPTLMGRMFARVLTHIKAMEETARVRNVSCLIFFSFASNLLTHAA